MQPPAPSHSIPWIRIWGQRHGLDAVETEKKKSSDGRERCGPWWLHGPFSGFVVLVSLLGCLVDFVLACLTLPQKWKRWRHGHDLAGHSKSIAQKRSGNQPGFMLWFPLATFGFVIASSTARVKDRFDFHCDLLTISRKKHNTVWSNWWLSNWLFAYFVFCKSSIWHFKTTNSYTNEQLYLSTFFLESSLINSIVLFPKTSHQA